MEHARTRWRLAAALCAGYFLVLLDVTVVNVALPQLGAGLHASSAGLAWVVDAYSVPLAALLLACGAIGDRLGHRAVVITGFSGFGAASILCALAPSLAVLIAARALQGASAALMLPGTLALLADNAPGERARARVIGLWASVGGVALPAGPLLGGLLVQAAHWRSVFWLSVPVIALALLPIVRLPRRLRRPCLPHRPCLPRLPRRSRWRGPDAAVDWAGAATLVVALGCLVTAVIQAPADPILGGAVAGLAVLAGAACWHVERLARRPLLRVPPRARRPLAAACAVAGLMNLCVLGSLFLLTQVLQDIHHLSPLSAGLLLLPGTLPLPLLGTFAGQLTARFGPWRTSALGLTASAAGFAGIAAGLSHPGYPLLLCSLAVWGAGLGTLTPAIVTAALRAVPGASGTASGASNTARQTGGALGVAIFSALAGSSAASGFTGHATWLLAGCALAFTTAAACCLIPREPPP